MAQLDNLLVVILTFLINNFVYFIVALIFIYRHFERRRLNPLDITILELTNNGVIARHEMGRMEKVENKGFRIVTVKRFSIKRVKDDLGYHIGDDDMFHSGHGKNRRYLIVAKKDKLAAPLKTIDVAEGWSEEEIKTLKKAEESLGTIRAVKFPSIPKTLNLVPINKEQIRFVVDIAKDVAEVEGQDEKKLARRMVLIAGGIFVFSLIISLVVLIVVINQSPTLANELAGQAVQQTVTNVPLPGVTG